MTLLMSLIAIPLSAQLTHENYIIEHYPELIKKNGRTKNNSWKFKQASTEYLNKHRAHYDKPPVVLSRWLSIKCDVFSIWHGIFYRELRHAWLPNGTWENLTTETEWHIDAWLDSPGHRSNMMIKNTKKIGLGTLGGVAVQRGKL